MALIRRVKVDGDFENRPELQPVLAVFEMFAERLGTGQSHEAIAHDKRDGEAMFDVMRGHVRRANVAGVRVHRHNCPHVPGFEEPSWTACTDPQYGYVEESL